MSGIVKAEPFAGPFDVFVGNADGRGLIRIETANDAPEAGNVVATMVRNARSKATADLFVTAVNSYASSQAEIERLRAALEPFAELAEKHHSGFGDDAFAIKLVTVGQLRRARTALGTKP